MLDAVGTSLNEHLTINAASADINDLADQYVFVLDPRNLEWTPSLIGQTNGSEARDRRAPGSVPNFRTRANSLLCTQSYSPSPSYLPNDHIVFPAGSLNLLDRLGLPPHKCYNSLWVGETRYVYI